MSPKTPAIAGRAERVRKPRGKNAFTQADITRAVRAVKAAGMDVARVEVDKEGKIIVIPGSPRSLAPEPADAAANAYDRWRQTCAESS